MKYKRIEEFNRGDQWRPSDIGGIYTVYGETGDMVVLFINTSWDSTVWHVVSKFDMRSGNWTRIKEKALMEGQKYKLVTRSMEGYVEDESNWVKATWDGEHLVDEEGVFWDEWLHDMEDVIPLV